MSLLNNRYQFQKIIGQGGMGRVCLVTDTLANELVVVKECCVKGKAKNIVERIKREYHFMNKVKHPNLVSARELFQQQDRYFIVMEFVEGITLKELIQNHPRSISFEKQLYIAQKICGVVAMLNENGVIHRDLKPENIILQKDNLEPKLLDLGIAKAINNELATITNTGAIIGTPQYISPEQVDPQMSIGKNTDVFALGAILHQFFTWQKYSPFYGGQIVSTLDRVINLEIPPLTSRINTTDKRMDLLSSVISQSLEKDPQQRIPSALEMLTMLISCTIARETSISNVTTEEVSNTPVSNTTSEEIVNEVYKQTLDAKAHTTEKITRQKALTLLTDNNKLYKNLMFLIVMSFILVLGIAIFYNTRNRNRRPPSTTQKNVSKNYEKLSLQDKQQVDDKKIERTEQQTEDLGFTYLGEKTYTCNGNTYTVKEYLHKRTGMEFVKIPGGSFTMGGGIRDRVNPAHRVILDSFLISKTEVTQGVWQKIMGTTPWQGKNYVKEGSNYAATYVSWNDAKEFCDRVGLQLPTEAQWEYACRSGSSDTYWGDDMIGDYAWYYDNTYKVGNGYAHQVAQKKPNAFGLYDMSGNVWEWCHDWYDKNYYINSPTANPKGPNKGSLRVARGGSWLSTSYSCRSRLRYSSRPDYRDSHVGFRPSVHYP